MLFLYNITQQYPIILSNIYITDKPNISITPNSLDLISSIIVIDIEGVNFIKINNNYISIGYIITTMGTENENDNFITSSNNIIIIINETLSTNTYTVYQVLLLVSFDTNNPQLIPFDILPDINNGLIENNNLLRLLFWEIIGTRLNGVSYKINFWTFFGSSKTNVKSNNNIYTYQDLLI
jgi:hypothetical protein